MVIEDITCRHCGSDDVVKNGFAPNNAKQKYLCHARGRQSREVPDPNGYAQVRKEEEEILRAYYQERSTSLRGLSRTLGVSPTTVLGWLKKPPVNRPVLVHLSGSFSPVILGLAAVKPSGTTFQTAELFSPRCSRVDN